MAFSDDTIQLAMVAYSSAPQEYLIVGELESNPTEWWVYETSTDNDFVRPGSLLALAYDNYMIVGAQGIRMMIGPYSDLAEEIMWENFDPDPTYHHKVWASPGFDSYA